MALLVSEDCINCDVCQSLCPNGAIQPGDDASVIDPLLCTECVGHFDTPQCAENCPTECVVAHPDYRETHEVLLAKHRRIAAQG